MGGCHAKPLTHDADRSPPHAAPATPPPGSATPATPGPGKKHWAVSPFFAFSTPSPSPAHHLFGGSAASPRKSPAPPGSAPTTPARRLLRLPFPPPSPAKHIRAALARRHGPPRPSIPEEGGGEGEGGGGGGRGLDKGFGFNKGFAAKYDLGDEVGRGHFGYTCAATVKKGARKGESVAVKVIPKAKMTTSIAIEDVRREVKILKALAGNKNLVQFYDAYEDNDNVYIVMELCEGGELLDRILSRGGKYSEDDAKAVLVQILNVVAFCHIQGVVHRDLKPENFLFTSKDDDSHLKAIDFGLSDFVKPDERLNDIVGSAYYVAPEVLHRCYSTEADVWSIGVIAYILLCGSRPFWARTESGIFRSVLKADPSYNEAPWPSLTPEAMDFVKRLLCKDPRRRMTAAQALSHPWIRNYNDIKLPLDILIFRLIKAYIRSSSLRKAALRALTREATDAMKESRVQDILVSLSALQYRRMEFQEFCAAAVSVHQLEALDRWEQHARSAYEHFEKEGNRAIVIDELASVRIGPQPFSATACRSARLDQAYGWEIELSRICQVIAWHVQQVPVKDEIAVDNL
ncbi:Putative CDPK-related protein kinase [Zea mays]|uniref:Putative CDPK-related protein kinase n=1 Tax=Zea mays TaxID=4577 RepID=A0A1D6IJT9_MAIZE|nr:Putative CDPK-related protein kinase [Zea mays]